MQRLKRCGLKPEIKMSTLITKHVQATLSGQPYKHLKIISQIHPICWNHFLFFKCFLLTYLLKIFSFSFYLFGTFLWLNQMFHITCCTGGTQLDFSSYIVWQLSVNTRLLNLQALLWNVSHFKTAYFLWLIWNEIRNGCTNLLKLLGDAKHTIQFQESL